MAYRFSNVLLSAILGLAAILVIYFMFMPDDLEQQGANELTLQLQWIPTAQFLGVYVAEHERYFLQEGLKVELLHGGPNVDPLRRLTDGDCNIALATADQVVVRDSKIRAEGDPESNGLVVLGTVFRRSVAVFMFHGPGGETSLSDLQGMVVGVYPNYDSDHILKVLVAKAGFPRSDVSVIPFPQIGDWYARDLDVFPSYLFNEPIEADIRDVSYRLLDPEEHGVLFYSDTIVVTQEFFQENRETLLRFHRALERGWIAARSDPKAAVEMMLSLEQAAIFGRGGKREALLEGAKGHEVVKYLDQGDHLFAIDREHWLSMVSSLKTIQVLDEDYDPEPLLQALPPEGTP